MALIISWSPFYWRSAHIRKTLTAMSKSSMTVEKDIKFQFQLQKCAFELCLISLSLTESKIWLSFNCFLILIQAMCQVNMIQKSWQWSHVNDARFNYHNGNYSNWTTETQGTCRVCVLCNPIYVAYVCVVQVMYCNSGENKYHICLRGETELDATVRMLKNYHFLPLELVYFFVCT